jgi:hypothetical protein
LDTVFYLKTSKKPNIDQLFDEVVKTGELDVIKTKDGYTVKISTHHDVFKARSYLVKHLGEEAVKECEVRMMSESAAAKKPKKRSGKNTDDDHNEEHEELTM